MVLLANACSRGGANAKSANDAESAAMASATPLSVADIAARSTKAIVSVRSSNSLGTGFIVRDDGWIATNFHVAAVPEELFVLLADGRRFPVVEVVNASRRHDLAILRIDAKQLPTLPLGNSDAVRAGDSVVAIGHPLGLEDTVSNGLVSAVRHVDKDFDVLQISAPIAPGSSGGPLFNERGEVIGVAAAIMNGGQNLNFGLPVKYVKLLAAHPQPVSISDFNAAISLLTARAPQQPQRDVPHHPDSLLSGCDQAALASIPKVLGEAIEVGAPLYNQGNVSACFHIYEGAAMDLERRLPKRCAGPRRVLSEVRTRAAKLDDPSAQAWALRDAFDGLFEVVARHDDGPGAKPKK
ncbi:MAG: trypsin-like peptidase domain-containing protein [Polyangiaceae bacterium]